MRHLLIYTIILFLTSASFAQANQQWITHGTNVRARALPATTGEEVARLPIGTILRQLDNDRRADSIGGKQDFWYHVALPSGKEGWAFGTFLTRFEDRRKGEIYKTIAVAKLADKSEADKLNDERSSGEKHAEFADFLRFLIAVLPEVTDRATRAELELWRWVALSKALGEYPDDTVYQRFLKANKPYAISAEVDLAWLLKPEVLWNLQKKYADLPIADTIAWEATKLRLPGECEGDDMCYLYVLNLTTTKYLQLYPKGNHADEALDGVIGFLEESLEQFKQEEADRAAVIATRKTSTKEKKYSPKILAEVAKTKADYLARIAKLRTNIAKVASPKKTKLLQLLGQYEKHYR